MIDGQCPRVVETREPATETSLEDVLARNLSTHGAPHAPRAAVPVRGSAPNGAPHEQRCIDRVFLKALLASAAAPASALLP